MLRATSPRSLSAIDPDDERLAAANLFRDNLIAVAIMPDNHATGERFVWGNVMQGNLVNVASALSMPTISELEWTPSGLTLRGRADFAAIVHLYAGPPGQRRYAGSTPTIFPGAFSFDRVDVDPAASEFSVIAHSHSGRVSPESQAKRLPTSGSITSISPTHGRVEGGQLVQICGDGIISSSLLPTVVIGGSLAKLSRDSTKCVTITTPPSGPGPTDIALLLPNSRPVVVEDAFIYHQVGVVPLKRGWNRITWEGPDMRVTGAFTSISGSTFRVYVWDADSQEWLIFSPELPATLNTLTAVSHDQLLWIKLDSDDTDWTVPTQDAAPPESEPDPTPRPAALSSG